MTKSIDARIAALERARPGGASAVELGALIRAAGRDDLMAAARDWERCHGRPLPANDVQRAARTAARIRAALVEMNRVTDGTAWRERERAQRRNL